MSTIEDFENAPVGATATSPDGRQTYRRETKTQGGADWANDKGEARLWADADGLAHFKYTLDSVPAPAPTTTRGALDLAWELAYPVKEGQHIPSGTHYLLRHGLGYNLEVQLGDRRIDSIDAVYIRTLDPLPDPEPDWLDAPAVLARGKHWEAGPSVDVFTRSVDMWQLYGCDQLFHWSDLADVIPLYPKEEA